MPPFLKIATGLNVAAALAELAAQPEYWLRLNPDESRHIPLLGAGDMRLLENQLPAVWHLIDAVLARAVEDQGDHGTLSHARVGLIPPGGGLPPHYDGIDGVHHRRYQLALQSLEGAVITVDGEAKCLLPGEAWQIDVSRTHSMANGSDTDRIVILFDTAAQAR